MSRDLKRYIESCPICQKHTVYNPKRKIIPISSSYPFEKVMMDYIGPMVDSKKKYGLVMVDHFTKWPEVYPLESCNAETTIKMLEDFISRHGCPDMIFCDNGKAFIDKRLKMFCKKLNINLSHTTLYHPQSNGAVERVNRTLKETLKKLMVEEDYDWSDLLPMALFAIRTSPSRANKISPYKMIYGRDPVYPIETICGYKLLEKDNGSGLSEIIKNIHEVAKSNNLKYIAEMNKSNKNKKKITFKENELVLYNVKKQIGSKFKCSWIGPLLIIHKDNYKYKLKDLEDGKIYSNISDWKLKKFINLLVKNSGDVCWIREFFPFILRNEIGFYNGFLSGFRKCAKEYLCVIINKNTNISGHLSVENKDFGIGITMELEDHKAYLCVHFSVVEPFFEDGLSVDKYIRRRISNKRQFLI